MTFHVARGRTYSLDLLRKARQRWQQRREDAERRELKARSQLLIETLEPRILMSATPLTFVADPKIAQDLQLGIVDKLGVPTIQMMETATSKIVMERAVADTSQVTITLSNLDDRITVTTNFTGVVPVSMAGGTGTDTIVGRTGSGLTFAVSKADIGTVAGISFGSFESLTGQNSVNDTFAFGPLGSLSGGADGGTGGTDVVLNAGGKGQAFTIDQANGGTIGTTKFVGIEKLQGADGFNDVFTIKTGGSLSGGLNGGAGDSDTLTADTGVGRSYTVSRANGGSAQGISFDGIENIKGEANVSDLFVLVAGGSLTGGVDGGAGGNDVLRLSGAAAVGAVKYDAIGVHSGRVTIDGLGLNFTGLEPIDDTLTAATRTITGTAGVDAMSITQDALGKITVAGPTFEKITFAAPTNSLVVNGGGGVDAISIDSNLSMPNVALTLSAEAITVAGRTVNLQGGGGQGKLDFSATGLVASVSGDVDGLAGKAAATAAAILITNSTIAAAAIHIASLATLAVNLTATKVAALGFEGLAKVDLIGSTLKSTGAVDVSTTVDATLTTVAKVAAGAGNAATDAAAAVSLLNANSLLTVDGTSIVAGTTVGLLASTIGKITTVADARGNASAAGASVANSIVTGQTALNIKGTSSVTAGDVVNLSASSKLVVSTSAYAAAGAVSGATPRSGALLTREAARTPEGDVTVAAAVAVNALDNDITASIGGTFALTTPKAANVSSIGTHTVGALADSSPSTTTTNFAAAAAINDIGELSKTSLGGALNFDALSVGLTAAETSTVTATSTSGAGSSGGTAVAGSLAFNKISADAAATLLAGAVLDVNGAPLTIAATVTSTATAAAKSAIVSGSATGVGASVALNFTDNDLFATMVGTLSHGGAVTLLGVGVDTVNTSAVNGAAGGVAVTPVFALASNGNDSTVAVENGDAFTATSLALDNSRQHATNTTANASLQASNVAVGAAIALTLGAPAIVSRLDRQVTVSGAVAVSARRRSDSQTSATASAGGDVGKGGNANFQTARGLNFDKSKTGRTTALQSANTSSGAFGSAAAIGYDGEQGSVTAVVDVNGKVTSTAGSVLIEALSDVDSAVTADGSVVKGGASVGVGAAVAINALSLKTGAAVRGTIAAQGITVRAGGLSTDASSPNKDVVSAKAVAGAGATTFGIAGALGLNVLDLDATAQAFAGSSLDGGAKAVALGAAKATDTTTVATSDAKAGSGGASASGIGIGVGVALAVLDNDVTAQVDGGASVAGTGGLSLTAQGTHAAHGLAQAGAVTGSVAVAPSTFIVVSTNDTLASLPNGADLTLKGAVALQALHAMTVDGKASASGAGATAGIGLSLGLGLISDTAQALVSRSLTTDGAVTVRATNAIDVTLNAVASTSGAKADGAQTKSDDQIGKELSFANAKKGGTAATAPKTDTSSGAFGLAGALALSIVNGQSFAQVAVGKTLTSTAGSVLIEALSDVDSSVLADGSVVKGGASVGVGAAVAINALSLKTGVAVRGTIAAQGITVRAGGLSTDASSPNKDVVSAKAVAGAGATTFGIAGALGLNVLDLDATAQAFAGSSLDGGAKAVALGAAKATDTTTVATSDAKAGSGGASASGIGIGVGVALAVLDNDVTAQVDGGASVAGTGGLSLTAQGTHAAHGLAQAGAVTGSVAVAPSTFIVVSTNDTLASLPNGADLTLKGAVALQALHAMTVDGKASASGAGATAGIGLSLGLGLISDTAQALVSRSLTTDGAVTVRATNAIDVTLNAVASTSGAKADGAQTKSDDQIGKELSFANAKKGGTAATAKSVQAPDANGNSQAVGIAGAISLSIVNGKALAVLPLGKFIKTAGVVTLETIGDVDSRLRADGSVVDGSNPTVGVGVAVALNVINFTNTALVAGDVTSGGLVIHALAPAAAAEARSDITATALSGAGAKTVGIAGSFAANFVTMPATAQLTGKATETPTGDVEIKSEVRTAPQATASSSPTAIGQAGSTVGIGLSFALNVLNSDSTAEVANSALLAGGGSVTISAIGEHLSKTKAVAGSSQSSVGISPSVALLVASNQTIGRLGIGTATNMSGLLTISAKHKLTGDTSVDASVKGATTVGVGAAVALNIASDTADAAALRNISAGKGVAVVADLAVHADAASIASTQGATPKGSGEPTTSDGQVASLTQFGNSQSGNTTVAPQVVKANGGTGAEQAVGVAAALAMNILPGHARATLPSTITITSAAGGVAVTSALDVDGSAKADSSTAKGSVGIGVAVAINVVATDNTALLAAPTTAKGAVTVSATMSTQGDGVDTFAAIANSGAGAKTVGVASAVALNLISNPTSAKITAAVKAGGGSVTIATAVKSDTTTTASSEVTANGGTSGSAIGVGASFALTVLDLDSAAELPNAIPVTGAGNFSITASGVHAARTTAKAGSAGNVAISPAVAITVATSNTTANLGTGTSVDATGNVLIDASHGGDYTTTADASAGGANVSVGAAIAVGVVLERGAATVLRDIAAGGDVRVRARNPMSSSVSATAGASGNTDSSTNSADLESNAAVNNNSNIKNNADVKALPGGKVAVPQAGPQATQASNTAQSQSGGKGSGGVGVGAAISVNAVTTDATAQVAAGRTISSGGTIEVSSALQVDASSKAFGTAIKDTQKNTAIGAGVALNVVNAVNSATIGANAILNAKTGLQVSATMAQRGAADVTNEFVVQSAAASGANKVGIAGSVSIDVVNYSTTAAIGPTANAAVSVGAAAVQAAAAFSVQNLAGSGAFGSDAGIGAAVVAQISSITTNATIGNDTQLDAKGGLTVSATSSYVPRSDSFKGISGITLSSGAFGGGGSDSSTAVGGSVAVNVLNITTQALVGTNVKINQRLAATGAVAVSASSTVSLFGGAGGVGVSLGNTGIGIGIDVTLLNQKTLAQIGDTSRVSTAGDISTTATSRNTQTTIAGSFGAAKQNGGAGSIIVNLFNTSSDPLMGTRALIGTGVLVKSGGKVSVIAANPNVASPDSMRLIAGSAGLSGQTAVGIASITSIRNDTFEANIGDNSAVGMATGLDVIARSGRSITMIAAAGAGGVKTGAAGSLTVSTLTELAKATIGAKVTVTGTTATGDVHVFAEDRTTMVRVAGAVGFGGNSGIGAGLDVNVLNKTTVASIGALSAVTTAGSVELRAFSKEDVTAFAASGGAGSELAIAGSVNVNVATVSTRAFVEGSDSGRTKVTADGNVIIEAADEYEVDLFAGGLDASGQNAVGVSAPVPVINKTTEAFAGKNTSIIGKGLLGTAAVRNGGFTTTFVASPTSGTPEVTTTLTKGDGFSLVSKTSTDPNKGLPGGTSGVGDPNAGKVRKLTPGVSALKGVAISATSYDDLGLIGISAGAAGSVAVNVAGVVNVSNITTSARVDDGAIVNVAGSGGAAQDVLVTAAEDYSKLTVSIGLAVSGSVAIAPSVAVDAITLKTEALIGKGANVSAIDTVAVKARSAEDIQSVIASLSAAGTVSIAGSPAIVVLSSTTTARVGSIGSTDSPATVNAGGSVVVQATDDTKVLAIAGSGGFAGSAGIGAGVGIVNITKDTTAQIAGGSTIDAGGATGVAGVAGVGGLDARFGPTVAGLVVEAGSIEKVQNYGIAGGVGGYAGVAGGVGLTLIDSNTAATIGNSAKINQTAASNTAQGIRVAARNDVSIIAVAGGLGGGLVGIAGAIGVGIVRNGTEASIGTNTLAKAGGLVNVDATSKQNIVAVDASAGLGGFAGAISFGTWIIGGNYNDGGGAASESAWSSAYQSTVTGAAYGGYAGVLGSYKPISFAAADVNATANTINLKTSTLQTGDAVVYRGPSSGGVAGLVNGQTYYVVTTATSGVYRLALTAKNAEAGTGVDLTSTGIGSFDVGTNVRALAGLNQARVGLATGAPKAILSSSLNSVPSATTASEGTVALVKAGVTIAAGGGMRVNAQDDLVFTQVSGQVAAGGTSVGGAFATLIHKNTVMANVGNSVTATVGGTGLAVSAISSEKIAQVAAGAGAAGSGAVLGSVTVSLLTETTTATLGNSVKVNGAITVAGQQPDVTVIAKDNTTLTDVAGAIGFGGAAAVGIGTDVATLSKTTYATVGTAANILTAGSFEVRSNTSEDIVSAAIAGTVGGSAAVSASASIVVASLDTEALLAASAASNIIADGNAVVEAYGRSEYDLWGGSFSAGGAAAVGGAAAIPVITKKVKAEVGDGVSVTGKGMMAATTVHNGGFTEAVTPKSTDVSTNQAGSRNLNLGSPKYSDNGGGASAATRDTYDANQTASGDANAGVSKATASQATGFRGVAVTASNSDDLSSMGMAAGAAGVASVQLAGAVQVVNVDTMARVGTNAKINFNAASSQDVLVASGNDFRSLNVGASAALAGVAGVAPSASVEIINLSSQAIVESGAYLLGLNSVTVSATSYEKITAVSAALAVAGVSGTALSPNVLTMNTKTIATLGNTGAASGLSAGSVAVLAKDTTRLVGIVGAVGVGGAAGVGAAANIALLTKNTQATVGDGSTVTALGFLGYGAVGGVVSQLGDAGQDYAVQTRPNTVGGLVIQATSQEDITALAGAGGAGFFAGIAGAVNIVMINSDTVARLGASSTVNSGVMIVSAANTVNSFSFSGSLAGGIAGIGGSVNVGTVRNGVNASVGSNANVTASGSAEVIALSRKRLDTLAIGVGVGVAGLTGSIGIVTIGGNVDSNYSYGETNANGYAGATKGDNALGDGATGWNTKYDGYANGSTGPGGSNGAIVDNHVGSGGSNSRVAAAAAAAKPLVSAGKPKTSITAQLTAGADLQGTIAHIDAGAIVNASGDGVVRAQDATTVTSTVGSFAGGVVSLGAPVTIVNMAMPVRAIVADNARLAAGGNVFIAASETSSVKGYAFAGQGGLGAFGAQVVYVKDTSEQTAEVHTGARVSASGSVSITASADQSIKARAFGATFSGVGAGVSLALGSLTGATRAYSDGVVVSGGAATVAANVNAVVDTKSFGVGLAGLATLNGAVSSSTISKTVDAHTGAGSTTTAGGLITVQAGANMDAPAESDAIAVAGGLGLGIAVALSSITPLVTAIASGAFSTATGVSVIGTFNSDPATGNKIAGRGGRANAFSVGAGVAGGAGGAIALANTSPNVTAQIGDGATVNGTVASADILVRAATSLEAMTTAGGKGFGIGFGVGASITSSYAGGSTTARIGNNAVLGNGDSYLGSVTVEARSSDIADAQSTGLAGGLFAAGTFNSAYAQARPNILAEVGSGVGITAESLTMRSAEDVGLANSRAKGVQVGGVGVAAGASQATSIAAANVTTLIGGASRTGITLTTSMSIDATTADSNATAESDASGGAVLGSVQINKAVAQSTGTTTTRVNNATVVGQVPVHVGSTSHTNVKGFASGKSIGLLGVGSMQASVLLNHATLTDITGGSSIGLSVSQGDGGIYIPVGSIDVSSVSSGLGNVRAEGAAAGLVAKPVVQVSMDINPSARSTVGAGSELFAQNGVTVSSNNKAEGDASLSGASGGFVGIGATSITQNVSQTAETLIGGGAYLHSSNGQVSITATGGTLPQAPRNYTVNADGVVAASDRLIITGHGLKTGDIVQVGTAGSTFGSIDTGRVMPILKIDDNTIMFGRDVAGSKIDAARDIITFDGPHFLQTGDFVKYGPVGGSSATYYVYVLNDTKIKLLDFDPNTLSGLLRLAGKGFTAGNINAAADTITINGHGFADGALVTYHAAPTIFSFGSGDVDLQISGTRPNGKPLFTSNTNLNQIYIPGHTFQEGDLVKYTAGGGPALANLAKNGQYMVHKVDDNFIQLLPSGGGAPIAIDADPNNLQTTHTLAKVGSGPVQGLIDGVVYKVQKIDNNTIKLTTVTGTVINLTTAGVGTYTLARDGVDLAPTAAVQRVTLDLTAGGSATLLGVGGVALDTIIADTGDGVSRLNVDGMVLGVVAGGSNKAISNLTSTVRAIVSGDSSAAQTRVTGSYVSVYATAQMYGSSTANGDGGGLFAFPSALAQTFINGTTEAMIGDPNVDNGADTTYVYASNTVTVQATAQFGAEASAGGESGGLVATSDSNAKAATNYLTRAGFGHGATVYANSVSAYAYTTHSEKANMRNSAGGLGAGSSAGRGDSGSFATGDNLVLVGSNAKITSYGSVYLTSYVSNAVLQTTTYSYSGAAIGGSKATAQASAEDKVGVLLQGASLLRGQGGVFINSQVYNYSVSTNAKAELDAAGGKTVARSDNRVSVRAYVQADAGSRVEAKSSGDGSYYNPALYVTVSNAISRGVAVDADGATFGPDDEETPGSDNSVREIVWNGDVLMLRDDSSYKSITIGSNGLITAVDGITVNGGYGYVGAPGVSNGYVSIDNITIPEVAGRVKFRVTNNYDSGGNILGNAGSITGTQGHWTAEKGASVISISNYSTASIIVNNIDTLGTSTSVGSTVNRTVSLEATNASSFRFDLITTYDNDPSINYGTASVQINNYSTNGSAIFITGLINNPMGSTYIQSYTGSILQNGSGGMIRSNYVNLASGYYSGQVGIFERGIYLDGQYLDTFDPLKIELVEVSNRPQPNLVVSSFGSIGIEVWNRIRAYSAGSSTSTVSLSIRSTNVDAGIRSDFHSAYYDYSLPSSAPYGIVVGTSNPTASGDVAASNGYYREYYLPDFSGGVSSPNALAAFGTGALKTHAYYYVSYRAPSGHAVALYQDDVDLNIYVTSGVFFARSASAASAAAPASQSQVSAAPASVASASVASVSPRAANVDSAEPATPAAKSPMATATMLVPTASPDIVLPARQSGVIDVSGIRVKGVESGFVSLGRKVDLGARLTDFATETPMAPLPKATVSHFDGDHHVDTDAQANGVSDNSFIEDIWKVVSPVVGVIEQRGKPLIVWS